MSGTGEGSWSFSSSPPPKAHLSPWPVLMDSAKWAKCSSGSWTVKYLSPHDSWWTNFGKNKNCIIYIPIHPSTVTFHSPVERNSFSFLIIFSQKKKMQSEKETINNSTSFHQAKISVHWHRPPKPSGKKVKYLLWVFLVFISGTGTNWEQEYQGILRNYQTPGAKHSSWNNPL